MSGADYKSQPKRDVETYGAELASHSGYKCPPMQFVENSRGSGGGGRVHELPSNKKMLLSEMCC